MNSIRTIRLAVVAAFLLAGTAASGQNPYTLSMPDINANSGTVAIATLSMDSSAGADVQGLSTGVCSDPTVAVPISASQGASALLENGGMGVDFFQADLYPNGVTVGMVVNFLAVDWFSPAPDLELMDIEYDVVGALGDVTALQLCNTLGNPPVLAIVVVGGASIVPATVDGSITVALPLPAAFGIDASGQQAIPNATVTPTVTMDSLEAVSGFSFGLTTDVTQMTLNSAAPTGVLAATNGGSGPDVFIADLAPAGGIGATIECTISGAAPFDTIAAGLGQAIIELEYDVAFSAGPPCSTIPINFVDTLGVPIEVTVSSGPDAAAAVDGEVLVGAAAPAPPSGGITLEAENAYTIAGDPVSASIWIDNDTPVEAISFGILYDATDISLGNVQLGSRLAQLRCGAGPEFFAAQIITGASSGVTVATVFGLQPPLVDSELLPGSSQEIASLSFTTNPNPLVGGSILAFTDTLGAPPVAIEVTVGGQAVVPATIAGSIGFGDEFVRGDCNVDSTVDIADAVYLLGNLFPGPVPVVPIYCDDSCDGNDDGLIDIADAITLLDSLFGGGSVTLPPPTGICGPDPTTTDTLVCLQFFSCP